MAALKFSATTGQRRWQQDSQSLPQGPGVRSLPVHMVMGMCSFQIAVMMVPAPGIPLGWRQRLRSASAVILHEMLSKSMICNRAPSCRRIILSSKQTNRTD
jgi:hypothetical protein